MKWQLCVVCITVGILLLSGCNQLSFDPYDYKKQDDAKVKMDESPYSLGIRGRKFYLRRDFDAWK